MSGIAGLIISKLLDNQMPQGLPDRLKVSYHIKDLLKKDVNKFQEIAAWLSRTAVKKRDRDRGTTSKLLVTRYLAALAIEQAMHNPMAMKELMDRTEGKVADKLEVVNSGEIILKLEQARARVIGGHNAGTVLLQQADNSDVIEGTLDMQSSVEIQVEAVPVPTGGSKLVPSAPVGSIDISTLPHEDKD